MHLIFNSIHKKVQHHYGIYNNIYRMTLQQQEYSICSDLEKTTLSITNITRAYLCRVQVPI